ncbi:MAG: hypothetical protein LM590_07975 [Thermofilum sp.]|nr:hypothetical protein [Thermofilum sp.]
MELGASLELWGALEVVSSRLTELARETCRELGLDLGVSALASLERIYEDSEYGREICGYYDPVRRLVVVSLPCLAEEEKKLAGRLAETLAHELVHHCQFTRGPLCEVHLDPGLAARVDAALPYRLRPHEVEAYGKQRELAERLRGVRGFDEAVGYVRRLLSPEVVLPLSEVAKTLSKAPALKESARLIAELTGEDLLSAVRNLEKRLVTEDETVRECYRKEIAGYLQKIERNPADVVAEELRKRAETFLSQKVEGGRAKIIITDPGIAQPRAYVVSNNGIAIGFDLKKGAPPLLPLLLETAGWGPSFKEPIRLQMTLAQILKGAVRAGSHEFRVKVLPRENINVCKELYKELYNEYWKEHWLAADVLLALLLLSGWKMQALESRKFGEAECFAVAVEDPGGMERLELIVPSNVRVKDESLGIDAPLKDAVERLKSEESSRDFIIRYFTEDLTHKIIFKCNEKLRKKMLEELAEELNQLLKVLEEFDGKEKLVPEV